MIELQDKDAIYGLCDERYVKKDDCDTRMSESDKIIQAEDRRLAVIETRLNLNNWLTGAIAAGIIALVIKVFLGG